MKRKERLKKLYKELQYQYPKIIYPIRFDINTKIELQEGEVFKNLEVELFSDYDNPQKRPIFYCPIYKISNKGRIFDERQGELLSFRESMSGYQYADMRCLYPNYQNEIVFGTTGMPVDWLVYNTFDYQAESTMKGSYIFHNNGNKKDSSFENLKCVIDGKDIKNVVIPGKIKRNYNPYKNYL